MSTGLMGDVGNFGGCERLRGVAGEARPGLLVLYHQLYWGRSDAELVAEVKAHYDGAVVSGEDLGVY